MSGLRAYLFSVASAGLCACQAAPPSEGGGPSAIPLQAQIPVLADRCIPIAGYRAFRSALEGAVHSRHETALRALFHREGRMRIDGMGGVGSSEDWGLSKPEAASAWAELEHILDLGCTAEGDRLVLPAMGGLVEHPEVTTDHLVAIEQVELRRTPGTGGPIVGRLAPGDLVTFIDQGGEGGWSKLLVDGEEMFAPGRALRSPYSIRILLERFDGAWRILEITDGV